MEPAFERAVLVLCSCRPRFWERVGRYLDPDSMLDPPVAKAMVDAVRAIAAEVGQAPSSVLLVLQRLRRLLDDGKVTQKLVDSVGELVDQAEDFGLPDEDEVAEELAPVLRRRMQSDAVVKSHDEYARRGDFSNIVDLLSRAERVGKKAGSGTVRLGSAGLASIEQIKNLQRLSTGVMELDLPLAGGPSRGTLTLFIGEYGVGKSNLLVSRAAEGLKVGNFVGIVSLELTKAHQFARLVANLTGVPVDDILDNQTLRGEAGRRLDLIVPKIGLCHVVEMAPGATTTKDLVRWVDDVEAQECRKMDQLVVDYADKLHDPRVRDNNTYLMYRYIYEDLRHVIAERRMMWVDTASQAGRSEKKRQEILGGNSVADSMHKVRVPTLVITMTPQEEGITYFVDKNNFGKSRFSVGPIPHDFARARVAPLASEFFDWSRS